MIGPVAYQQQVLKRRLYAKQQEILRAIDANRSVSIAGCHGSGKTFLLSGLIPYKMQVEPKIIVLVIAPTLRQVKNFWAEVHQAIDKLPCRVPEPTTVAWKLDDDRWALGFSSAKGVNAQGFHNSKVLIIVDEAIGISEDLWDALEGVRMAGDVSMVKLCNPTVNSGPVYEDFTKHRQRIGHAAINISAFDTPNLAGHTMDSLLQLPDAELDYAPYPALARRRAVVELYHKWGPTNPRFVARVLGQFPGQADDAIFRGEWIEQAGLPYEPSELKPLLVPGVYIQVGLDIAGEGSDNTAAWARIGPYLVDRATWPDKDPFFAVLVWLGDLAARFPGAALVIMGDTVGIGYNFMLALARKGFTIMSFKAGERALNSIQYRDRKAEGMFTLREYMRCGQVRGLIDEDTKAQLADIRYREPRGGRIEVESKREMKARGVASPDEAEALMMAYYPIVAAERAENLVGALASA